MNKKNLTIDQLIQLKKEIEILQIINDNISILQGYYFKGLTNSINSICKLEQDTKEELIRKYGVFNPEYGYEVKEYMLENNELVINKNYTEFMNNWQSIGNEERELEHRDLKLDDFKDLKTNNNISLFFEILD